MARIRAAVIGLGQAGSRFDEEPRESVWSHVGAYLSLSETYELVAGVDPSPENRERFRRRCPDVATLTTAKELNSIGGAEVISVATPPSVRMEVFETILSADTLPRVIVCEKPLAIEASIRMRLVDLCSQAGVVLLVHYNRRYTTLYQTFASAIRSGRIGELQTLSVRAPNRLWSVGSHAIDLLLYLAGEVPVDWRVLPLPLLAESGEPASDFVCRFPSGAAGRMLTQGPSRILLFEVEAIGTLGRLFANGNGQCLTLESFSPSDKFVGYWVPDQPRIVYRTSPNESAFVNIANEAAAALREGLTPTCSGEMALTSEGWLDRIVALTEESAT